MKIVIHSLVLLSVFGFGFGCAPFQGNKKVSASSIKKKDSHLDANNIVSLTYDRCMKYAALGGEYDEGITSDIFSFLDFHGDRRAAELLKALDPEKVSSLRVFVGKDDLQGRSPTRRGRRFSDVLRVLERSPYQAPWPIEKETAKSWKRPGFRLDWGACSCF